MLNQTNIDIDICNIIQYLTSIYPNIIMPCVLSKFNPILPINLWKDWVSLSIETLDYDPKKVYNSCISPKKVKVEHIGSTPSDDVYNSKPYTLYQHIDRSKYIIPYDILLECYEKSIQQDSSAKEFLEHLYKTDYYKKFSAHINLCGPPKKICFKKRGSKAKNWKNSENKYICPSLHKANNIYEKLSQRKAQNKKNSL